MTLFNGTVGFYRQYRPGIPEEVAAVLDQAAPQADGPRRLLDVGTGTGLVVEALLGRFDDIIAVVLHDVRRRASLRRPDRGVRDLGEGDPCRAQGRSPSRRTASSSSVSAEGPRNENHRHRPPPLRSAGGARCFPRAQRCASRLPEARLVRAGLVHERIVSGALSREVVGWVRSALHTSILSRPRDKKAVMQHEYEAKFLAVDVPGIQARLRAQGAVQAFPRTLLTRRIFESTSLDANQWVRLRDEGERCTLTLKQVTDSASINGTTEIETEVSDPRAMAEILTALGLHEVRYQENFREEWRLGDLAFDFDTWPGLPTFLEIEGPDEASVREAAVNLGLDYATARFGSVDTIYRTEADRDILAEPTLLFPYAEDDHA